MSVQIRELPLKAVLSQCGIPQYKIASKAGMSESRLSRLATKRALPTLEERQCLAELLGVPAQDLFPESVPAQDAPTLSNHSANPGGVSHVS